MTVVPEKEVRPYLANQVAVRVGSLHDVYLLYKGVEVLRVFLGVLDCCYGFYLDGVSPFFPRAERSISFFTSSFSGTININDTDPCEALTSIPSEQD